MLALSFRTPLLAPIIAIAALLWTVNEPLAQTRPVSIFIVRHAEVDSSQATIPLTAAGRQRGELLIQTFRGVKFTHLFATHTTRTRQMLESIATMHGLPIVQFPVPGSMIDGTVVTEQTSRRAPIEPIGAALLKLPPGSVALASLNSENIYAILNRLGVPVAASGQSCAPGSMCVPCTENSCYPRNEFDQLWHVVLDSGRTGPLAFVELRYGAGWRPSDNR
jgi:hypothetical protein